ncbi:MAG: hypothetical protein OXC03_08275 [Flavobacteriaceae bacterium]|nr:hypothetical protein [Flavobacteriaceae bacterium]
MILPHPESNLKTNIMVLGAEIIGIMSKNPLKGKYVLVEDVMNKFLKNDKNRTPDLFMYAVTLLHTIGSLKQKDYKIKLRNNNSKRDLINLLYP